MKARQYSKKYFFAVEELLKSAECSVCPTEYFSEVPRLLLGGNADKLHMLLYRANTVVALEEDTVVGFASMDAHGGLGLLYVGAEFKRAVRPLLKALEKRAGESSIPLITVTPAGGAVKALKDCGYAPPSEQDGKSLDDVIRLEKRVVSSFAPADFPFENAKKIVLDPNKPIKVLGKVSALPFVLFGTAVFFAVLLTALGVSYKLGGNVSGGENIPLFAGIVGVFGAVALTVLVLYLVRGSKLKRQVLTMRVTNAVITDVVVEAHLQYVRGAQYGRRHMRANLTYVYFDENGVAKEGKCRGNYDSVRPDFYTGQEIVVAYADWGSYVLQKYTVVSEQAVKAD